MSESTGIAEPEDFGDPRGEYAAARETAALFDLSGRTHIELGGRDRAKFLHNFCTNDIRAMKPGEILEAFVTSVQGKILAFVSVYATETALWLTSVPGCAESLIKHLSRYQITEDVTFADRSKEVSALLLAGPQAPEIAEIVVPIAANLEPMHLAEVPIGGATVQVRRHDFLRLPCLVLIVPGAVIEELRVRLNAAGAKPAGRAAFEALRIEAGFPLYGVDITDANLAQEASRTPQAISFTKGCYLGQEPIARIDALGHVNQQLRGLRLSGGSPPAAGTEVFTPGANPRKAGHVTSSARSFADDRPVVLAYIRRGFEIPGTELEVHDGENRTPAVVFWTEPS